jgi:Protein of unknown function (DUF2716)
MNDEALERLRPAESSQVWDRFYAAFDFRPSMYDFPAITEPAASVTWSLDALNDDPGYRKLDRLVDLVQDALTACTPPDGTVLILDWQHTSYRLRPHLPPTDMFLPNALNSHMRQGWPLSPYPDGDYYILIAEDFAHGSFGHPWEHSLCLFGTDLLETVADDINSILGQALRRSGRPATQG